MTPAFFFSAIRRYWYLIIAGLVVGALASAAVGSLLPKTYAATAQILLSAPKVTDPAESSLYVRERMPTYAQFIESESVLANARSLIGTEQSTTFLANNIESRVEVSTVVITITASWSDPQGAADLANAVARSYGEIAPRLDSIADPILRADIVETAVAPNSDAGLSLAALLLLGATAGLAAGLLAALLLRTYRTYAQTVEDLSEAADAEVLAVVAVPQEQSADSMARPSSRHSSSKRRSGDVGSGDIASFATLYSRSGLGGQGGSPRMIAVLSTVDGAHAARVAWGVAATSAASGQRCLLLAVDEEGRTVLASQASSTQAANVGRTPHLMTSEAFNTFAGGITTVDSVNTVLRTAAASKDIVVIAAPPLDADANSWAFVQMAGETLLATPRKGTRIKTLSTASRLIRQAGASILGVVATTPDTSNSQATVEVEVETETVRIGARS